MSKFEKFKNELLSNTEVRQEYESRHIAFVIARAFIKARLEAEMTQAEVAGKMATSQSQIARMESGHHLPSLNSTKKYARAVNRTINIAITP